MAKGREIAAEKLIDVIDLIHKRRQSGRLSVEHFQGGILEEGELYFHDGEVIYAKAGLLSGQEAFNSLVHWRQVLFSFEVNARPQQQVITATEAASRKVNAETVAASQKSAKTTDNLLGTPPPPAQFPMRNTRTTHRDIETPGDSSPNTPPTIQVAPEVERLIPRRIDTGQNVLSLPLTRPQRSMYLLVDGQRSLSDLARCTRKNMQEVDQLLRELQQRGLVAL